MPVGLKFQRKHPYLGYKLKYFYYCLARREILQKKCSYGNSNENKIIYIVKPDYQDGVEGLLSLIYKQVLYINYAKQKGFVPYVDWKNYVTQYFDGKNNVWNYFFKQPSKISEKEVYSSKNVYLSGWTFKNINYQGLFESDIFFNAEIKRKSYDLLIKNLSFSDEILNKVCVEAKIIDINRCIGVYVRGTDYIKLKPSGEYVQPNIRLVEEKIDDFNKKYNSAGWVFMDYRNSVKDFDKNTILYAHGRVDGTMFGSLKNITKSNWYNNSDNHVVKLSTEYENTLWQVFSIYRIPEVSDYLDIDFNNNEEYVKFLEMLQNRSEYKFDVSLNEEDKILTLSTCYKENDRVVLHAKLIKMEVRNGNN